MKKYSLTKDMDDKDKEITREYCLSRLALKLSDQLEKIQDEMKISAEILDRIITDIKDMRDGKAGTEIYGRGTSKTYKVPL